MESTFWANQYRYLSNVIYSKTEAAKTGDNPIKILMVYQYKGMIAAIGWWDGNLIHFLTTSDEINRDKI